MRVLRRRGWSRTLAVLLLLVTCAGVPHFDKGDRGCAPVVVDQHDESKHAIGVAVATEHPHCAICHWTRLPRTAFAPIAAFQSPRAASLIVDQRDPFTHRAPALDRLPARAPPAAL